MVIDLNLSNLFRELPAFAQYENSNKYKIFREVHHRSTGAQKTQESSRHSQAPMALLLRPSLECSVQPQPQCHQAIQPFRHQGISLKSVKRYFSVKTNLVICTCIMNSKKDKISMCEEIERHTLSKSLHSLSRTSLVP